MKGLLDAQTLHNEERYAEALAAYRALQPANQFEAAQRNFHVGVCLAAMQDYDNALTAFEAARMDFDAIGDHLDVTNLDVYEVKTLLQLGRATLAHERLTTDLTERLSHLDEGNSDSRFIIGQAWFELGNIEEHLGNLEQMRQYYDIARVYIEGGLPPENQALLEEVIQRLHAQWARA